MHINNGSKKACQVFRNSIENVTLFFSLKTVVTVWPTGRLQYISPRNGKSLKMETDTDVYSNITDDGKFDIFPLI
jgi:hypothetical protein